MARYPLTYTSTTLSAASARRRAPLGVACALGVLLALMLGATVVGWVGAPAAAAASLPELQREAKRVRTETADLQQELQVTGQRLVAAQERLDAINVRLQQSRGDLSRAEAALDRQREVLAARAVAIYKTGDVTWLDMLSGLDSLADIETVRSLFQAVAVEDRRAEIVARRLATEARRLARMIEHDHEQAVLAEQEVQDRKIDLDAKLAQRQAILQDVTKRIKKILASGGLGAALAMASNGQFTQITWAKALLVALRYPVTADNVAAITAWEMAEGGHWYNTAYYNPLNTTQTMPGSSSMNSVGVKAYTSWKQGFEATVKTLRNGYYGAILAALQRGNDAAAVAAAVGASPWGTGNFSHLL